MAAAESELAALEAENGSRLAQLLDQGLLLAKVQRLLGFETEELSPSPNELLGKLMYVLSTRTALEAENADLAEVSRRRGGSKRLAGGNARTPISTPKSTDVELRSWRMVVDCPSVRDGHQRHPRLRRREHGRMTVGTNTGCWLWSGSVASSGYGQFCTKRESTPIV